MILIVAGVSGSGKTTVATALAQRLGLPFEEGDQPHPPPDIAKMHHPLDDRDQWSWLEKIAAWIDDRRQLGTGGVITCPALRRSHRDFLTRGRLDVSIVYLHGERTLIASRLAVHEEEHSTLSSLLDHHFAILEEPEPDEDLILIDVSRPLEDILAEILRRLIPQVRENPSNVVDLDSERPAVPPVTTWEAQSHPSSGTLRRRGPFIGSDLPLDIEDYALIGDCTTAALVGRKRLDRLAVLAAL